MLTQALLKSQLSYDPETGLFTRTLKTGIVKAAGCRISRGYIVISINSKLYYSHRLAWLYVYGEWPEDHIDHINGIKDDNRFCNLREATPSENLRNRGANKNSTSGFKGVNWHKTRSKWRSNISFNGKQRHLGCFDTPEEAHQAYCKAAKELHGEFANIGVKI